MQSLLLDHPPLQGNKFEDICQKLGCDITVSGWPDIFGKLIYDSLAWDKKITTLSLFAGAGGLDIGFHDVGFDIIERIEIEQKFCDTLELNTGEGRYFTSGAVNCIDISEYKPNNLPKIDFIIGGPPCQTFSAAGRRVNGVIGTGDARGSLFREYVRLLEELSPEGFLFENVYGITGAQNGRVWQEILSEFSKTGYKLFFRVLDAADYGVPQHRERLIIVGLKNKSFAFPRPTHGPDSLTKNKYYTARQAIKSITLNECEKTTGINGRFGHLLDDIPPGLNYSFYTEEMGHPNPLFAWRSKFSDFLYKADPDTPVRTIKAQGGQYSGPFHWDTRRFSVSEHKRLQTFPDEYELSGNKTIQIHQIGNSVPPQMARILAIAIRSQIFNMGFDFELSCLEENEQLGFRQRKRNLTDVYRKKASTKLKGYDSPAIRHIDKLYSYFATITDKFEYKLVEKENADFSVSIHWNNTLNNSLNILVHDVSDAQIIDKSIQQFTIIIHPNEHQWNMSINQIKIDVISSQPMSYTVAWKALEYELMQNNVKADLVQLCGYYHYVPKINCELKCPYNLPIAFLIPIVNGSVTRRILQDNELAKILGIPCDDLINYAQKMRDLGYEIRNHNTNPQIKKGQWLIPYAFPTFTPLSIQLRKSLK